MSKTLKTLRGAEGVAFRFMGDNLFYVVNPLTDFGTLGFSCSTYSSITLPASAPLNYSITLANSTISSSGRLEVNIPYHAMYGTIGNGPTPTTIFQQVSAGEQITLMWTGTYWLITNFVRGQPIGALTYMQTSPRDAGVFQGACFWATGQGYLAASIWNLARLKYVGDALNATAKFWFLCNNPTSNATMQNSRSTSGQYIKVPDYQGQFVRASGNSGMDGARQPDTLQIGSAVVAHGQIAGYGGLSWTDAVMMNGAANMDGYTSTTAASAGYPGGVWPLPNVAGGPNSDAAAVKVVAGTSRPYNVAMGLFIRA